MEQKIMKLFNGICECNDTLIQTKDSIVPILAISVKDKVQIIAMVWNNNEEKEQMRNKMLKFLANQEGLDGYIFLADCYLKKIRRDGDKIMIGKTESEAIVRNAYTSKEKISEVVRYKDKKIISKETTVGREQATDGWDLWNNDELANVLKQAKKKDDEEDRDFQEDIHFKVIK